MSQQCGILSWTCLALISGFTTSQLCVILNESITMDSVLQFFCDMGIVVSISQGTMRVKKKKHEQSTSHYYYCFFYYCQYSPSSSFFFHSLFINSSTSLSEQSAMKHNLTSPLKTLPVCLVQFIMKFHTLIAYICKYTLLP